jgi:hypothetical protein
MSEHSAKPSTTDDEIDLSVVFKAIKDFLLSIVKGILGIFNFYYKHKFILLGIVILGAVLGYFYEQNVKKTYTNDLLVIPNYGSADYIYTKVEALNKKLKIPNMAFIMLRRKFLMALKTTLKSISSSAVDGLAECSLIIGSIILN